MPLTLSSHDRIDPVRERTARQTLTTNASPAVLVIDDDGSKRGALCAALQVAGFTVHGASSGRAVEEIAAADFDFAIVDLMLHGTNGFELARRLRVAKSAVRVVLTSAYHFSEVQLARVDCGAIAFLPQPFAIDELTSFLRAKLA